MGRAEWSRRGSARSLRLGAAVIAIAVIAWATVVQATGDTRPAGVAAAVIDLAVAAALVLGLVGALALDRYRHVRSQNRELSRQANEANLAAAVSHSLAGTVELRTGRLGARLAITRH